MASPRRYTKREKVTAVMAAEIVNAEAASEQTGIPRSTIRRWLEDPELVELRLKTRESMAADMKALAMVALEALMGAIRRGELEGRDLVVALGVAIDKAQLLSGEATSRTETRDLTDTLDDHERARLRDILDDVLRQDEVAAAPGAGVDPA